MVQKQIRRLLTSRRPPLPAKLRSGALGNTNVIAVEDRLLTYGREQLLRASLNETDDLEKIEAIVKECILRNLAFVRQVEVFAEPAGSASGGRTVVPVWIRVHTSDDDTKIEMRLDRVARDLEIESEQ